MTKIRIVCAVAILAALVDRAPTVGGAASGEWPQWGGPHRNFMSDAKWLASSWPSGGPKKRWSRSLGEGHSSILVDGGRLYTQYRPLGVLAAVRRGQEEAVIALDAATGQTVWEFKYPAPTSGIDFSEGAGPHSTPLVVENRLYAASSRKELFALDKTTGQKLWSHDLMKEYGAPPPGRGYSCSPLSYKGTIIVTLGGPGQALAAFNQHTGGLLWKSSDSEMAPASPILIDVDGQEQVVVFGGDQVVGVDPARGGTLWSHPHKTDWGLNISTPVWSGGVLFVSSAYGTGSRALELHHAAGRTTVIEKWFSRRMRVHIGTVIRLGDYAYGSSGDFGPAFITALDMNTGEIAFGLATVSPQGLKVLARADILERLSWTPPTLAETTLYVRDRKNIAAFDLGAARD